MLLRSRPPRLCTSCRSELVHLFDFGFTKSSIPRLIRTGRLSQASRPNARQQSFSILRACRKGEAKRHQSTFTVRSPQEPGDDVERVQSELEALEALEKELAKPLLDAIEEDQRGAEESYTTATEYSVDGQSTAQSEARRSGDSAEAVAREARQYFGDTLPANSLNAEELKIYKRLYGEPAVFQQPVFESEGPPKHEQNPNVSSTTLFDHTGAVLEYQTVLGSDPAAATETTRLPHEHHLLSSVNDSSEDRVRAIAESLGAEIHKYGEEEESRWDDSDESPEERSHILTRLGQFATSPRTIFPSQDGLVKPITKVLSGYSNKHLKETCERTFGGPGLPDSPLTPLSGRMKDQIPIPLEASQHAMGETEANAFLTTVMPPTYAAVMSILAETRKRLGTSWLSNLVAKDGGPRVLDAGAGGAGIIAWREVVQAHWDAIHSSDRNPPPPPPSKSVVLTGSDTLRHRAANVLENTTFVPLLPDYVHARDTPTLDDNRAAQQHKQFDIIIASHTLFGLKEEWMRKQHVQNLWSMLSPDCGVLILLEKGVPRGFEAIAGARQLLLDRYISSPGYEVYERQLGSGGADENQRLAKEKGMIVAPCTTHATCPMYRIPGVSRGRKDFCSFQQRYIRPPFLQRVLGASDRSHDDVDFSYIAVVKGRDLREKRITTLEETQDPLPAQDTSSTPASQPRQTEHARTEAAFAGYESIASYSPPLDPDSFSLIPAQSLPLMTDLPRLVFPPLKRRGHVSMDLCTPQGTIERWTVPRSFSKQAYRDARKSRWGDLWALGAKTRVTRTLRLGTPPLETAAQRREAARKAREEEAEEQKREDSIERGLNAAEKRRDERRTRLRSRDDATFRTLEVLEDEAMEPEVLASASATTLTSKQPNAARRRHGPSVVEGDSDDGELGRGEQALLAEWRTELEADQKKPGDRGRGRNRRLREREEIKARARNEFEKRKEKEKQKH